MVVNALTNYILGPVLGSDAVSGVLEEAAGSSRVRMGSGRL